MSGLPDPRLVERALAGTDADLDVLARAWLPQVYRWCHRLGGPTVDAEDAAHDALIIMCRRLPTLPADRFGAWLFAVTRKVVANHRRRAWFRRWVPGPVRERVCPHPGPQQSLTARRDAERVWVALAALPVAQREVLVLCELEDRTGPEVAALLGVPLGTVKSRLRTALIAFRAQLEPKEIELTRVGPVGEVA